MGAKKFSHTHRLTMCGLKKLASAVFPESWKVLAERRQRWRRRRRKRTKNNKSPGYPGWLNECCCLCMVGISCGNLYKQKYLYCQNQYPVSWIGKCHSSVAQQLEHSASNPRGCGFASYHFIRFQLLQEQSNWVLPMHCWHFMCES